MPRNFDKEEHTTNYWRAMSLKVDSAVAAFHSQLSSILEKLVVFALEEIKALAFEYCEELSQEKRQNRALSERIGADQDQKIHDPHTSFSREPQDGNNDTGSQESTLQLDSSEGEENEEDPAEGQHVTLLVQPLQAYSLSAQENFFLEKFDQVDTVCPENPSTDHEEEDCSQSQEETEHSLEPQFCCEPPEDSKELLRDCKQTVEATSYNDILPSEEDCPDVEFQIKREAESPDIKTGRNIDINGDVRQRMSYDTYTRSVDHPIGPTPLDIPGTMLDSHALNLPNQHTNAYISSYETHFGEDSEPSTNPQQIKRPSKYVCDFCNKTFSYPSDLKRHRLSHTQERTHVCGMCGKAFITRSHLRRHELMHIDVQPSVCSICGHKTSRLAYLKIHMKMHIKNKHV